MKYRAVRRSLLAAAVLLAHTPLLYSQPERRALVGAIRWDAWHGHRGRPGIAVQQSLGPQKWHYRLPFFARIISQSEVTIDGSNQEIMDQELEFAVRGGLDYWAFVTYDPDDPMSLGLKHYLASKRKQSIRFCLITEHSRWGTRDNYETRVKRFVDLMREDSYLTVHGNRPLIYLGFIREDEIKQRWETTKQFRKAVEYLRSLARKHKLGNPYIVIMDFDPQRGNTLRTQLGADAISAYAAQGNGIAAPYSALTDYAEAFWERCKATGSPVVPIVMSGWDRRPRVEHPVPWEVWQKPGIGLDRFYEGPRPEELTSHVRRALDWIRRNQKVSAANAALIYAWNENDEGGWLVPTLSDGAARLDALAAALKRH